jgi:amphi-Trp domain-containing protein
MAKKDRAKARQKSGRVQYELTMSADAVAAYLEGLAGSLRRGTVAIGEGSEGFHMPIAGDVEFEVEARHGKRKSRVELSFSFRATDGVLPPTSDGASDGASGDEQHVATIPDEMSF